MWAIRIRTPTPSGKRGALNQLELIAPIRYATITVLRVQIYKEYLFLQVFLKKKN